MNYDINLYIVCLHLIHYVTSYILRTSVSNKLRFKFSKCEKNIFFPAGTTGKVFFLWNVSLKGMWTPYSSNCITTFVGHYGTSFVKMGNFQSWLVTTYNVKKWHGCNVASFKGCKVKKLKGYKVARLQSCKVAKLQGCKVARLQGCEVARLQRSKVVRL